ncbi:MAG: VCBS domain-containing protein, partial [Rhodospirillales bacterium]|nr:VCBS domain-containing protein [Rhodospirillales bacterium]
VVALETDEDTNLSGTLAATVSDADAGDSLTFALVAGPAAGTLTIQPDGGYSFDPGTAFQGLDTGEQSLQTFTYSVSDGETTVQRTATLTISGANDAPSGLTTAVAAVEDTTVGGTLQGSDVDIESLTFAVVSAPAKGVLNLNADGTYTYTADNGAFDSLAVGQSEDVTFTYSVSDGDATTEQTATITVTGANDAPTVTEATVTETAEEDGVTNGTLADTASDTDTGDTLSFALVSPPAVGTLTINSDGSYSFDAGNAFQGLTHNESTELSFVYSVTDGQGVSVQKTAALTVSGANDAPTQFYLNTNYKDDADPSNDDTISVDRVSQAGTVVGTVQAIADADAGDTHSAQLIGDADGRFVLVGNEVRVAPDATFSLDETITVTVRVTDAAGASFDKTFDVDVQNVVNGNSADGYIEGATVFADADGDGELDAGEASATTDVEGNFRITDGVGDLVMTGGTDVSTQLAFEGVLVAPEGSSVITPLTSIIAKMVGNGASNADDAQTKMAAATGITGSLSSALNGSGASSLLHFDPVEQTVDGVSGAIDVLAIGIQVQNSIDIISSALVGATDGDANALGTIPAMQAAFTAMASAMSAGASFAGLTNPAAIQAIIDSAATGAGLDETQQALVSGAAEQIATIVTDSNGNVNDILAAAADPDSPITTESALTQLAQASVIAQGAAADAIADALAGTGGTVDAAVSSFTGSNLDAAEDGAAVGDVDGNDAPIVTAGLTQNIGEDGTLNGTLTATDEENDSLTFALDSAAKKGSLTFNADGTFSYTPDAALQSLAADDTDTDTFTFTVSDGIDTVTETVTITIQGSNDGPVAVTAAISGVSEDKTFEGNLAGRDVDAGAALTFAIDTAPAKGTLSLDTDGSYSFDPGSDFQSLGAGETEDVTFAYTVSDGTATSAAKTVTITVNGSNDGPVVSPG